MQYETTPIIARIHWCRLQEQSSVTHDERAGWRAEEAGLVDALGSRDRIAFMRKEHRYFFPRYQCGIEDGQALLRLSTVSPNNYRHVEELSPAPCQIPSRMDSRPVEAPPARQEEARG